jgi:hypothetical protein
MPEIESHLANSPSSERLLPINRMHSYGQIFQGTGIKAFVSGAVIWLTHTLLWPPESGGHSKV